MQQFKIKEPLQFSRSYGKKCHVVVAVGKLSFKIEFDMQQAPDSDEAKPTMSKPTELQNLETAGMEFDYSGLLAAYESMAANEEQHRAIQKAELKKHEYQKSAVVQNGVPTIKGAKIRIETEEEFCAPDRGGYRNSQPYIFVEIDGVKSTVRYRDTAQYRSYGARWRYCVQNEITEGKDRQYGSLEKLVAKLKELVPEYKARTERKRQAREYNDRRDAARIRYMATHFPQLEKKSYGNSWELKIGEETIPVTPYWHVAKEEFVGVRLGNLGVVFKPENVQSFVEIFVKPEK